MVVSKTSRKGFQINIQERCLKDVSQQHISRDGISIQQIDQITLGVPRTGKVADSELGQFIRLLNNPESLRRFWEYLVRFKGFPQLGAKIYPKTVSAQELTHPRHPLVVALKCDGVPAWDEYLSLIHISEPTRLGMISYAVFC